MKSSYRKDILEVGLMVGMPIIDLEYLYGYVAAINNDHVIVGIDVDTNFYGTWNKREVLKSLDLKEIKSYQYYVPFSRKGAEENIECGWWKVGNRLTLSEMVKRLEGEL